MGLDKAIRHGKEKRRQYKKSAAVDASCRHGGSCDWCRNNRTYKNRQRLDEAKSKENGDA